LIYHLRFSFLSSSLFFSNPSSPFCRTSLALPVTWVLLFEDSSTEFSFVSTYIVTFVGAFFAVIFFSFHQSESTLMGSSCTDLVSHK
jgi:hypothetical protein